MKLNNLRQLIKEELEKATEVAKPGTYTIKYHYRDNQGETEGEGEFDVPEGNTDTLHQIVKSKIGKSLRNIISSKKIK
jgi:hypothetical protein